MPANTLPIFPVAARIGVANLSSASSIRTTTGTTGLVSAFVAGTNGSRIDRIRVKATATTTDGMVRIWIYSGAGNAQLLFEIPVSAVTPSATVTAFETYVNVDMENLPAGYTLYATTEKAEAMNVIVLGGDW